VIQKGRHESRALQVLWPAGKSELRGDRVTSARARGRADRRSRVRREFSRCLDHQGRVPVQAAVSVFARGRGFGRGARGRLRRQRFRGGRSRDRHDGLERLCGRSRGRCREVLEDAGADGLRGRGGTADDLRHELPRARAARAAGRRRDAVGSRSHRRCRNRGGRNRQAPRRSRDRNRRQRRPPAATKSFRPCKSFTASST
jgi:hypothetical protein